jgi:penicillin-binding protein 2
LRREYKISLDEDWVTPEETLLDSNSEYQDLEMPISNSIFRVAFFIAAALCTVILAFVFDLSIRRYDYFAGVAFQNKSVNFSVPPPRGIIFDRLGRPLVTNEPIFNLLVISREAREAVDDGSVDKVADILNRNRNEFKTFILEGGSKLL